VVAGDGPLKEELMKQSTQNVEWVGFIDGAKKRELIRHSKSVLFPSTWPEPLSTIAYEAFEQERCIIANSTGGMPEIIENGRTGFLLEPDNQKQWINVLTSQTTESLDDFGKEGRLWLQQNASAMNWNKGLDSIIRKAL
jgi:glycosyltransferase involved in cell wall biosynthesis